VVAHRGEALVETPEHPLPVVLDPGHLAVGRPTPVDGAAVRRDQALHAQADAEHGHGPGGEHLPAHHEVGGVRGMSRAG
jgi:hypothetical protein